MHSFLNPTLPVEEIYSQSLCSRQISRSQLRQLQSLIGLSSIHPQQNRLIRRLLHASRRGWLNITD
jgi:hypothetical protein